MSTPLIVPYRRHPLSCALPTYPEAQLHELAESIKFHGLKHKIVIAEGMILDGWNRLRACSVAKVPPDFRELLADESAAFVVLANNIDRRDLSKSEKAFAVADIFFIVNALWSRSTHEIPVEGSSAAPLVWSKATIWKQTKAQLAARAGVKERMMQDVLRIRGRGEQRLIDAVRSGDISVEDAASLVAFDIDGQYRALDLNTATKANRKAKRVAMKRSEASARAESKGSRHDTTESPALGARSIDTHEASDVESTAHAAANKRRAAALHVSALMDETSWRLGKICEALTGSTLISQCEHDSAALAAVCHAYLALVEASQ